MITTELQTTLKNALLKLEEAMSFPKDEPHMESTIQRFEYTFELSWKLMNSILKDQGIEAYGTKNIIREANRLGLIDNTEIWFKFALARNQASHIYNEKIAKEVYDVAREGFLAKVKDLLQKTETYI